MSLILKDRFLGTDAILGSLICLRTSTKVGWKFESSAGVLDLRQKPVLVTGMEGGEKKSEKDRVEINSRRSNGNVGKSEKLSELDDVMA